MSDTIHNPPKSDLSTVSAASGMSDEKELYQPEVSPAGFSSMSDEKETYRPEVSPATAKTSSVNGRYVPYTLGRNEKAQFSDLPEVGPDPDALSQKIALSPQQYSYYGDEKVLAQSHSEEAARELASPANISPHESREQRRRPWYKRCLCLCVIITFLVLAIIAVVVGAVLGTVLPKRNNKRYDYPFSVLVRH